MTDELILDPEMESESQALANYEDELRELAEEVNAQDEDLKINGALYEEAMKHLDEETAKELEKYAQWNREGKILDGYSFEMFRPGTPYENKEDESLSIVECIEYGSFLTNFHVSINKYGDGSYTLFVHLKNVSGYRIDVQRSVIDYADGIRYLNRMYDVIGNEIYN